MRNDQRPVANLVITEAFFLLSQQLFNLCGKGMKDKTFIFLSVDSFSSALLVVSSKGEGGGRKEGGRRENFLTSFL